jgi:hypothetical protein
MLERVSASASSEALKSALSSPTDIGGLATLLSDLAPLAVSLSALDPNGRFRVWYLGTTLEVCFAGTLLRNPPVRILALDDLAGRSIATVEVRRDLQLVPIHAPVSPV